MRPSNRFFSATAALLASAILATGSTAQSPPELPPAGGILDDDMAEYIGDWVESSKEAPMVGRGYRHDGGHAGGRSARFTPKLTEPGNYEIRLIYPATNNRATNAQVTIEHASGGKVLSINQREDCMVKGVPRALGEFLFQPGRS